MFGLEIIKCRKKNNNIKIILIHHTDGSVKTQHATPRIYRYKLKYSPLTYWLNFIMDLYDL